MKELKKNVDISEDNICRVQTAMVEKGYSNARTDIENYIAKEYG